MSLCPHCGSSHPDEKCPLLESTLLDSKDDPLLGEIFGDVYRIEWRLNVGGVGRVYRATHLPTGLPVAMKVLFSSQQHQEEVIRSFEREVEATRELRHPHIVEVYDSGISSRGERYLVMELLNGEDLAERLLRKKRLSVPEVVEIADQVLAALSYAHGRGVVHRDLKPGNIWLSGPLELSRIHVKLVDFGVARTYATIDQPRMLLGTPAYMAPEQLRTDQTIDGRADLYSLSVTLYELLTGRVPFDDEHTPTLFMKILEADPPSLREIRPDIPSALEGFLLQGLEKNPERRFKSAEVMRTALSPLRELLSPPAPRVRRRTLPPAPGIRETLPREIRRVTFVAAEGEAEALSRLSQALKSAGAQLHPAKEGVLGCFGQKIAYGDEARRAVASALGARFSGIRIAVASGRFLAEEETEAADAAQNLLSQTNLGEVRLDRQSYLLVRGLFVLRPAEGGSYIVGGEKPFGLGRSGIMGVETPTLGRDAEIQKILEAATKILEGGHREGLLVVGEAGLGKSRLTLELRRALSAARQHFEYLEGRGDPILRRVPFSLFARALRLGDELGEGATSSQEERIKEALFGEIMGLAQRAPLFLVLDDLQWADEASIALVERLLREADKESFLVLGLARPGAEASLKGRLGPTLELCPLRTEEVRALVQAISYPDPALEEYVIEAAQGNPYLVEEVLQALRDAGALSYDGERWRRVGALSAPISVGAQWFLQAQLDALPGPQKELLLRASVLGQSFSAEVLSALEANPSALSPLLGRGLLWERASPQAPHLHEIVFRHRMLREVAYYMLPEAERRELHRSAARFLAGQPERDARAMAQHLDLAGEFEAAISWLRLAAEQEIEKGNPEGALPFLERALALSEETPDLRFSLYLLREEVFEQLGQKDAARADLDTLDALARASQDDIQRTLVRFRRGRFLCTVGAYEEAADFLEAGLVAARLAQDKLAACEHLLLLAEVEAALGRYANALTRASQAHGLADSLGRSDLIVRALSALASAQHRMGDLYLARVYREQALVAARRLGDQRAEARLFVGLGSLLFATGRFASAEENVRAALALAEQGGPFTDTLLEAKVLLGRLASALGRHEEARGLLEEARTLAVRAQDRAWMARVRVYLSRVSLLLGKGAEAALDAAAEALELDPDPWTWASARAALALAHLARGDISAALAHARAADEEFASAAREAPPGPEDEPEEILSALSTIFTAAGCPEDARRVTEAAQKSLEERAALISDEATRYSFLTRPGTRREVLRQ